MDSSSLSSLDWCFLLGFCVHFYYWHGILLFSGIAGFFSRNLSMSSTLNLLIGDFQQMLFSRMVLPSIFSQVVFPKWFFPSGFSSAVFPPFSKLI